MNNNDYIDMMYSAPWRLVTITKGFWKVAMLQTWRAIEYMRNNNCLLIVTPLDTYM